MVLIRSLLDSFVVGLRPTLISRWDYRFGLKVCKVAVLLGTGCFLTDLDMRKPALDLPAAALPLGEVTDITKLDKVSTSGWM
jgi:hypothetical protein